MSYIVLRINRDLIYKYIDDVNFYTIYKDKNKIIRFCRKVVSRFNNDLVDNYYNDWKKKINNTDCLIVTDTGYRTHLAKYIKEINPNIKIIFYYWNIIDKDNEKILEDKNIDEFWTFDNNDSQKYNIKFFPQFYYKCLSDESLENTKIEYDAIFLGKAKDREEIVNDIQNELVDRNLRYSLKVVHNKKERMEYSDYLNLITKTRSIIDIVGESQNGLTLRCLEALFYSKKLITNNINIQQYDFYNPNNIFIIGKDDYNDIKDFISLPYDHNNQEKYTEKYSYENWVKTLIND